jgi:enamine deaminase RidA (YjgF/YER057c/UK114 family)
MKKTYINPSWMFDHPQFTSIISVTQPKQFHFFAGRCPADENYECVAPGDMVGQVRYVMKVLTDQLKEVGADWSDVVHRRIFTVDVDACLQAQRDAEAMSYFDLDQMPGSTLVGVTRLTNPAFLVEIEIVAVTG